jgi:hypothetical protein
VMRKLLKSGENDVNDFGWLAEYSSLTVIICYITSSFCYWCDKHFHNWNYCEVDNASGIDWLCRKWDLKFLLCLILRSGCYGIWFLVDRFKCFGGTYCLHVQGQIEPTWKSGRLCRRIGK